MSSRNSSRIAIGLLLACLLGFSSARARSVTLTWGASSGADGYRIHWGTSQGQFTANADVGDVLQYVLDGLDDCTTWYFGATAYTAAGESDYSNDASSPPAPEEVDDGAQVSRTGADAIVTWIPAYRATSSSVLRGRLGAFPVGSVLASETCIASQAPIPTATATDSGDPGPGLGSWYLIRGANACGDGTYGFQSNGTERTSTTCP